MTAPATFTVLFCRPDPLAGPAARPGSVGVRPAGPGPAGSGPAGFGPAGFGPAGEQPADQPRVTATLAQILQALAGPPPGTGAGASAGAAASSDGPAAVNYVGRRPGKAIDSLLTGRVLVVGEDADLAAVVLRLLRRELLGTVEVAYAAPRRTPFTQLWGLPTGPDAVPLARQGEADLVPLVRDDVGGVLVGVGYLGPLNGTVYVDEKRVLRGATHRLRVQPDRDKGLAVTVEPRRLAGLGLFARRPRTILGRAVQIGTIATTVVRDGVPYARSMDRWTFYKHTEPLRLIRGLF